MAGLIRIVTALAVLTAALGGLEAAWPTWTEDLSRGQLPGADSGGVVIPREQEHEVIAERLEARKKLLRRLAAGEMTLFEVAARFGELNRTPEYAPDRGWRSIEGRCDGEKLCRQVLLWVQVELQSDRHLQKNLRTWEAELRQHIACHGRVVLPR